MKRLIFNSIIFIFSAINLWAHPHTFIEVKPELKIKDKQIEKLHIKWVLDEMTSMMLIMELDSNANGKFEKDENNYIYENYFASLEQYNYYMKIDANKKIEEIKPTNFQAFIKKDRLIYTFDIENRLNLKNLKIDFFDEELFVGMMLEKDFIKIEGLEKNKTNKLKNKIFGVN